MKAPMPTRVNVGALQFRIKPVPKLQTIAREVARNEFVAEHAEVAGVFHEEEAIDLLGLTNSDEQIILIESVAAGPDTQAVTVLHEVLHAVASQAGMRDTLTEALEESTVKRLAPLLLQVLRDNPKLIEYLTNRRVLGKGSVY